MNKIRNMVFALVLGTLLIGSLPALAAPAAVPYVSGTYAAQFRQGTIRFTPTRYVPQVGYEGNFVVDSKTYPGTFYAIAGTANSGMVWYYGSSGLSAGSAVVSPAGGSNYSGTISFTDKQGRVTDSGTISVTITWK